MFEKSALLMICCDISTKSFENVPIACENCAKAIKKICRMISEGSCDTEGWSNVAENSALPS